MRQGERTDLAESSSPWTSNISEPSGFHRSTDPHTDPQAVRPSVDYANPLILKG